MIKLANFQIYCQVIVSSNVISRALKVSIIVGTLLNLINQGEVLFTLDFQHLNFVKLAFTYLVPYSVATYMATSMKLEFKIGTKAIIEADLECKKCGCEVHIKKDELIPECPPCGIKTKWKLK